MSRTIHAASRENLFTSHSSNCFLAPQSEISQLTLKRPFDRVCVPLSQSLSLGPSFRFLWACLQGYLVAWDLEREIWSHAFKSILGLGAGRQHGGLSARDCGLLLSEPMLNFPSVQQATEQVRNGQERAASYLCALLLLLDTKRRPGQLGRLPEL